MKKSAWLLGIICIVLAGAVLGVWWRMAGIPEIPLRPEIRGAILDIGLPGGRRVDKGLEIYSDSALLWDVDTKVINYEKNGYRQRPIASITKLMTAMVALDYGFDWDEQMDIKPEEYLIGGKLLLQPGETVSMRDLMYASLLGSANNATMALVRGLEVPETEFIQAMNRKAIEMGLEKTEFVEVTGLDKENVSTAYEVARMAEEAFQSYPIIGEITSQKEYTFIVGESGREHTIRNTNKLISRDELKMSGSKTGYLYEAGYCLVVFSEENERKVIAVVLGSPSEWAHGQDIQTLLNEI